MGKPQGFWTIRRTQKGPELPARLTNVSNNWRTLAQHPLEQEIAPENPQERFLFVPTGPFREEFRERLFGRADRIRTCDPLQNQVDSGRNRMSRELADSLDFAGNRVVHCFRVYASMFGRSRLIQVG